MHLCPGKNLCLLRKERVYFCNQDFRTVIDNDELLLLLKHISDLYLFYGIHYDEKTIRRIQT